MDKSLKVREDEWREKEHEILCLKWGLNFEVFFLKLSNFKKYTHKASIQISVEFEFELEEPKFHQLWLVNFSYGSAH